MIDAFCAYFGRVLAGVQPKMPDDFMPITETVVRNRITATPNIAPLYAARAPEICERIRINCSPPPLSRAALIDVLERELEREEFSMMEEVLDGSQ